MKDRKKKYQIVLSAVGVAGVAFLLAFAVRGYRLEDIHYKYDEWLGTLQPGPAIQFYSSSWGQNR